MCRHVTVPKDGAGMRLDKLLSQFFKRYSRSALARGIKNGQVRDQDGKVLRPSTQLTAGMELRITIPGIAPTTLPPAFPSILYEDECILAVCKPPGMPVHPSGSDFVWSLIALARNEFPHADMDLCHRLDVETSGVVLMTKQKAANHSIKEAFKASRVHKEYDGLCRGVIPWQRLNCDGPLGPAGGDLRVQQAVRPDGLPALTMVERVSVRGQITRVRCTITTGRTHQIRTHLNHAGYPLLGDRVYGVPSSVFLHGLKTGTDHWLREQTGAPRHALHCALMRFPHPRGGTLTVEAPLFSDMERWWSNPAILPHDDGRDFP